MHLNKIMIDLISEIRRRAPADIKPSIKLANPDVLSEIYLLYIKSKDNVLNALIRETFIEAGEPWSSKLTILENKPQTAEDKHQVHYITKVYRGQRQLIEVEDKEHSELDYIKKPQLIYRGQSVID